MHTGNLDDAVFKNVLNHTSESELEVIADQAKREVKAGKNLYDVLTEAQFDLGLSYGDTKKIEAMVRKSQENTKIEEGPSKADANGSDKPKDIHSPNSTFKGEDPKPSKMKDINSPMETPAKGEDLKPEEGPDKDDANGSDDMKDIDAPWATNDHGENKKSLESNPTSIASSLNMDKYAGLKSTLRKLRRQLNGHDHEDLDGMQKLLDCIEGVEKQLEKKESDKEERRKKRESEGLPSDPADAPEPAEPDEDEKLEASLLREATTPPGHEDQVRELKKRSQ